MKPLTQPMFYVLLSLREKRHGYEIMQFVEELTQGRVVIGPGTLYALLSRFEKEGQIDLVRKEQNKRVYQLTEQGEKLLSGEIHRLEEMLEDARRCER